MGCGKLVASIRGVAVQAFLVKHHRNAQPRLFSMKNF